MAACLARFAGRESLRISRGLQETRAKRVGLTVVDLLCPAQHARVVARQDVGGGARLSQVHQEEPVRTAMSAAQHALILFVRVAPGIGGLLGYDAQDLASNGMYFAVVRQHFCAEPGAVHDEIWTMGGCQSVPVLHEHHRCL